MPMNQNNHRVRPAPILVIVRDKIVRTTFKMVHRLIKRVAACIALQHSHEAPQPIFENLDTMSLLMWIVYNVSVALCVRVACVMLLSDLYVDVGGLYIRWLCAFNHKMCVQPHHTRKNAKRKPTMPKNVQKQQP